MCFIIGQFLSGGVLRGLINRDDQWGYRIPFALQWFWPCILIPTIFFAPESPWHLVRHNKLEEAERSIRRLQNEQRGMDPKRTLVQIVYTNVCHPLSCQILANMRRTLKSSSLLAHHTTTASKVLSFAVPRLLWWCLVASLCAVFASVCSFHPSSLIRTR